MSATLPPSTRAAMAATSPPSTPVAMAAPPPPYDRVLMDDGSVELSTSAAAYTFYISSKQAVDVFYGSTLNMDGRNFYEVCIHFFPLICLFRLTSYTIWASFVIERQHLFYSGSNNILYFMKQLSWSSSLMLVWISFM
jgi:hypothetical protein